MTLRRILLTFSVAFSLLLIFGFAPALRLKYENWRESNRQKAWREQVVRTRARNALPPTQLAERPGDRARHPRGSFAIRYVDENGFGIDTASGMVNYDRITDPDTMIALRLSDAQFDSLYEEALRDRLFEMKQPAFLGTESAGAEHWGGVLTVYSNHTERSYRWDYWNLDLPWSDEHKRLNEYVGNLKRMVEASPAYRAFPRPKGGYID